MSQLRIALTLPGEGSLGAFEAGAVGALVVGVQAVDRTRCDPLRIDVLTGASSGALTAVLAARALLARQDPVDALRRAWVTEPSLDALRSRDARSPLTLDRAREIARELMVHDLAASQRETALRHDVHLDMVLTHLRGLDYDIPRPGRPPIPSKSHVDWASFELTPDLAPGFTSEWAEAVECAIASASHPAAFPPVLLDRSGAGAAYRRRGVRRLPKSREFWYTDGGLVEREPLRQCIARAHECDRGAVDPYRRLVLVVRPEPDEDVAQRDFLWTGAADRPPRWTVTLARALRIMVTHDLYEDLREAEKTNRRLGWLDELVEALAPCVDDEAAQDRLRTVLRDMERGTGERSGRTAAEGMPPKELLRSVLGEVAGLAGKRRIDFEVVSAGPSLLGGGALLGFGGFVAERVRASDFLTGYAAMLRWMCDSGLAAHGLPRDAVEAACTAATARARSIPGWPGAAPLSRRTRIGARVDMLRFGLRAVRTEVLGRDPV